ncbi:MAG TPA: alpha/beta hydrolase, partial [Verrucomicrobiota bacterium]|nr:alpha/beta hydrolase [Verrucomicrobiota bacterium]
MNTRVPFRTAWVAILGVAAALMASEPQDIAFVAAHDGSEQRYVLILPEPFDTAQSHDLLICLHGHGSDRWQFAREDRGETRAARDTAAQHRMILVLPDYRARTSWMGPAAEADVVQIIHDLKGRHRIGGVVLAGGSMGATGALTFTALHPELVDGVVALNGHANHIEYLGFQEAIQDSFGGAKEAVPEEYRKRSAEFFADRFTMPVGITAGGNDTTVPPGSVLRLADSILRHNP